MIYLENRMLDTRIYDPGRSYQQEGGLLYKTNNINPVGAVCEMGQVWQNDGGSYHSKISYQTNGCRKTVTLANEDSSYESEIAVRTALSGLKPFTGYTARIAVTFQGIHLFSESYYEMGPYMKIPYPWDCYSPISQKGYDRSNWIYSHDSQSPVWLEIPFMTSYSDYVDLYLCIQKLTGSVTFDLDSFEVFESERVPGGKVILHRGDAYLGINNQIIKTEKNSQGAAREETLNKMVEIFNDFYHFCQWATNNYSVAKCAISVMDHYTYGLANTLFNMKIPIVYSNSNENPCFTNAVRELEEKHFEMTWAPMHEIGHLFGHNIGLNGYGSPDVDFIFDAEAFGSLLPLLYSLKKNVVYDSMMKTGKVEDYFYDKFVADIQTPFRNGSSPQKGIGDAIDYIIYEILKDYGLELFRQICRHCQQHHKTSSMTSVQRFEYMIELMQRFTGQDLKKQYFMDQGKSFYDFVLKSM